MTDEFFMKEALIEAKKAAKIGEWAIGTVVVLNGKIISRAYSLAYKTKTELDHAEVIALKKVDKILRANPGKAILYSTYTPCPMCCGAMLWYKIKKVVTGCDPDDSGGMKMQRHLPKFFQKEKFKMEWIHGVLKKECEEIFLKNNPKKKKTGGEILREMLKDAGYGNKNTPRDLSTNDEYLYGINSPDNR